jgi:hypothetical protein
LIKAAVGFLSQQIDLSNANMIKKILFIVTGFIALMLGFLGIFLPLLPTTPFLLLSAACFLRSSTKLYFWITHHKVFGKYIVYYQMYRAVSKKSKFFTILFLWLTISTTLLFFTHFMWLKLLLVFIAISITIHVWRLRNLTEEMIVEEENE